MAKEATTAVAVGVAAAASAAGGLVMHASGRPYLASVGYLVALAIACLGALGLTPAAHRLLPAVAPLVVAVLVGTAAQQDRALLRTADWGDPGLVDRMALLAALALVVVALLAAGVDVDAYIARGVAAVARGLTVVVGAALFAVIVMPAWALSRVTRRDVLRQGRRRATWIERGGAVDRTRSLASADGGAGASRGLIGRAVWAIGCLVLVAVGNYAVGWAWDNRTDPDAVEVSRGTDNPRQASDDPRIDAPAMAAYPWRADYFADLVRPSVTYWPFTESRSLDFRSEYINIDGWLRRSYRASGDQDAMPMVWMFGGSTTWGEGQRDEYTIASYLVRLSEEAGIPIRVANYGQRGWTHFQEMILYEQQLAEEPEPDLVLFYDGANEATTQSLLQEAVPSHTLAYTYAQRLGFGSIATDLRQDVAPADPWADAWAAYADHSAVHKVVNWLKGDPVGAQESGDDPDDDLFTGGQDQADNGGVYDYTITDQDGIDAGRIYERGKAITRFLSRENDVTARFFWQPVGYVEGPYGLAREQLSDSTIDIADTLVDHDDVFIDGGHTNEEGARLVAERIWPEIRADVEAWYADR